MKKCVLSVMFLLMLCCAVCAEDGYVRLAIKGTNVNLRPQPRATGRVVAQMNNGSVFIAEKWPIVCEADNSEWYKIVLAADARSDKISILSKWDSRFIANVAFVSAKFATISPLKKGDAGKISETPVGAGYSFELEPHWGAFIQLTEDNFNFFSYSSIIGKDTDIHDEIDDAKVIGRYKSGEEVQLLGTDADEIMYHVMDPTFKRPIGWINGDHVKKVLIAPHRNREILDFVSFNTLCRLYVGANIGEITRKWGDFKVVRKAFLLDGEYVLHASMEAPGVSMTFFEPLPDANGGTKAIALAIPYLQTFSISLTNTADYQYNKDWVQALLGEPNSADNTPDKGEVLDWYSEIEEVHVYFGSNGFARAITFETEGGN